jgi:hypothetical protein
MPSVLVRIRSFWRDRIVRPEPRTYDAACEELGGAPWRPKPEATDSWFLPPPPESLHNRSSTGELVPLDLAEIDLRKTMSVSSKLIALLGTALLIIVGCAIALAGGSSTPAKAAPAAVVIAAAIPRPSTAAPAPSVVPTPPRARPLPASAPAIVAPPAKAPFTGKGRSRTNVTTKRHAIIRNRHR